MAEVRIRRRRTRAQIERDRIAASNGDSEAIERESRGHRKKNGIGVSPESALPADSASGESTRAIDSGQTQTQETPPQLVETPAGLTEEARQKRILEAREYRKRRKEKESQSAQTLIVFVSILDGLAMSALGSDAAMLPFEREMIEQPLARIMARMEPAVKESIDKWTDPVTLIFGLGLYGVRLANIAATQQKARAKPQPFVEAGTQDSKFDFTPSETTSPAAAAVSDTGSIGESMLAMVGTQSIPDNGRLGVAHD